MATKVFEKPGKNTGTLNETSLRESKLPEKEKARMKKKMLDALKKRISELVKAELKNKMHQKSNDFFARKLKVRANMANDY